VVVAVPTRHPIFDVDDPAVCVAALRDLHGGELLESLSACTPMALEGSADAARVYVQDCRALTTALLTEGREVRPDLIAVTAVGITLVDGEGRPANALVSVLENSCAEAPFTPWTSHLGLAEAVAVHLTNRCRALLGLPTLTEPTDPPQVSDDLAAMRFVRRVRFHLNHPDTMHPLQRIMEAFDLSKTDTARLFGVSRQAVDHWLTHDVPADRQEKVSTLLALLDILQRKLKSDRLPGVARRPADAYGGLTMLELIAADRHGELLDVTRRSFEWHQAA
jgi:hypothetical protein